jgi:hypothetical protein
MTGNKGQQSLIIITFYKFRKLETIGNCSFGCAYMYNKIFIGSL